MLLCLVKRSPVITTHCLWKNANKPQPFYNQIHMCMTGCCTATGHPGRCLFMFWIPHLGLCLISHLYLIHLTLLERMFLQYQSLIGHQAAATNQISDLLMKPVKYLAANQSNFSGHQTRCRRNFRFICQVTTDTCPCCYVSSVNNNKQTALSQSPQNNNSVQTVLTLSTFRWLIIFTTMSIKQY